MNNQPYLICVTGIENPRLPFFIHYYKTIGIKKFIIISNRKAGEQYQILSKDDDINIILKEGENYKNHPSWIDNAMKELVPFGEWCLIADIDEIFVYPECESYRINNFIDYLESKNYDCVSSILLDIYSNKPITKTKLDYQVSPLNVLDWFDVETNELRNTKYFGGTRKRVFDVTPLITKYALFKNRPDITFAPGSHSFVSNNILYHKAAILHGKYDDKFHKKVIDAVKSKSYWNNSVEYVGYLKKLELDKDMSIWYEGSRKYNNFQSLIDEKVIEPSEEINIKHSPKVSVIICTYGRETISKELINSLENQTYKDFEVVIVNNNNYKISFKSDTLNFRIVDQKKTGLSIARNTGVYNSNGSYLYFIDDDVVLDKNCIQEMCLGIEKYNSDLIGGTVLLGDKFKNIRSKKIRKYLSELSYLNDIEFVEEPKYIVGANMMFKRSAFSKYGKFMEDLGRFGKKLISGEEHEYILRIQKYSGIISYVKNAIAYHYVDEYRAKRTYMIKRYYYQGVTDYLLHEIHKEFKPKYKFFENNLMDSLFNLSKLLGYKMGQISSIIRGRHERNIKDKQR